MEYGERQNKFFDSSIRRAKRIGKISPFLYVGDDGSVYEIIKHRPYGMFQSFKLIVPANNEPKYKTCKECGQIHNELESRAYDDVPTSIDVIKELGKKKPSPIKVDRKS
jgi:hypothetical protein